MTAPGLIWICAHGGAWSPVDGGTQDTKYIRADLHEAEIARLTAERDAALEPQPITVQDAARVPEIAALIEAAQSLNDDGDCHNAAEWFEGRLKKLNSALRAIAEQETQ